VPRPRVARRTKGKYVRYIVQAVVMILSSTVLCCVNNHSSLLLYTPSLPISLDFSLAHLYIPIHCFLSRHSLCPSLPLSLSPHSLVNKSSIAAMSTHSASLSTSTERAIEVLAGLVGRTHVKEEIVHGSYRYVQPVLCRATLCCAVLFYIVLRSIVLNRIDVFNIIHLLFSP
jgi:hypothetical protein